MAWHAADFHPGAVAQQHVLDDRQAQAGAAGVGVAARIDAVETFGQARQVLAVDADPRVLHAQVRALLIARADVKREFRIEQTMLRSAGNNPVKFAASVAQAGAKSAMAT